MSDASRPNAEIQQRYLRPEEKDLVRKALGPSVRWDLDAIRVVDAADGGMGGVRVSHDGVSKRSFGSELARLKYVDSDRVPVSITLNADEKGDLFEIDFWKVDFSPLVSYPRDDQLKMGDP